MGKGSMLHGLKGMDAPAVTDFILLKSLMSIINMRYIPIHNHSASMTKSTV